MTPEQRAEKNKKAAARRRNDPNESAKRKAERDGVRLDVIEGYGGACNCCGTTFIPHLTLDHVNGGGRKERQIRDQMNIYRELRNKLRRGILDDRFQILCWNCNATKHYYGECHCQTALVRS